MQYSRVVRATLTHCDVRYDMFLMRRESESRRIRSADWSVGARPEPVESWENTWRLCPWHGKLLSVSAAVLLGDKIKHSDKTQSLRSSCPHAHPTNPPPGGLLQRWYREGHCRFFWLLLRFVLTETLVSESREATVQQEVVRNHTYLLFWLVSLTPVCQLYTHFQILVAYYARMLRC